MRARGHQIVLALLLTSLLLASNLLAQETAQINDGKNGAPPRPSNRVFIKGTAVVRGTIVDGESQQKLLGASIVATPVNIPTAPVHAVSGEMGQFELNELVSGTYTITVSCLGYAEKKFANVQVSADEPKSLSISLAYTGLLASDRNVTASRSTEAFFDAVSASRRAESGFSAPASVNFVEADQVQSRLTLTAVPDTTMAVNQQAGVNESPDSSQFSAAPTVATRLDSLYQLVRGAIARGDWSGALFDLHKIRMLQSRYRDVDQLFAEARAKLLEKAEAHDTISLNRPTPLLIGGFAVVVLAGLMLGFLFLSPVGRARMQRWRGNDNVAALIYESLLARRPSRMKLYPAVAEIYLKMNRCDETALQIYRRVLELNLPSAYRADMNVIVALNTVYEKATSGEVIAGTDSFISEEMSPGSSVLLADSGFQVKEKTPARRPRKKKEATVLANETTANAVSENGVAAAGGLLMDVAFSSAPAKPRKPRKKKEVTADSSNENDTANGTHLASGEQQLATPPVKKPRRKKVTVVDSIDIAETMTSPLEVNGEVAQVNLRNPQTALDEAATPAPNEPAPREEMSEV